jgi:hypothetical protein
MLHPLSAGNNPDLDFIVRRSRQQWVELCRHNISSLMLGLVWFRASLRGGVPNHLSALARMYRIKSIQPSLLPTTGGQVSWLLVVQTPLASVLSLSSSTGTPGGKPVLFSIEESAGQNKRRSLFVNILSDLGR